MEITPAIDISKDKLLFQNAKSWNMKVEKDSMKLLSSRFFILPVH